MQKGHKIAKILCDAIQMSLAQQMSDAGELAKENLSHRQYAKEFCTVRFQTARSLGHTAAISAILNSGLFDNTVLLSQFSAKKTRAMMELGENVVIGQVLALDILRKKIAGKHVQVVFIDPASAYSQSELDEVYAEFIPFVERQKTILFVLVG